MIKGTVSNLETVNGYLQKEGTLNAIISPCGALNGKISSDAHLTSSMSGKGSMEAQIFENGSLAATLSMVSKVDAEPYSESYEVLPAVNGSTLNTRNKFMKRDISIGPIPYYEVSNATGMTVNIGG
jgi:hypothetical protein